MARLIFCVLLAVSRLVLADDPVQLSESFGGPHGNEYSDAPAVGAGQMVASLTLHVGERCHGLELHIAAPTDQTFSHGGEGGSYNTLTLGAGEYITSMEVHWAKHKGHTRVFYLRFETSGGNSVSGGSMTDDKSTVTAPEGYQLGGFFGRDGDELDMLGAVWTKIVTAPPAPEPSQVAVATEAPAASADEVPEETEPPKGTGPATQVSETYGGPHGDEFSDQYLVTSGQTISSLTLHVGARCHGLELIAAAPTVQTFTHGGTGGNYNELKLGAGEYITSMEVHWGKKDGHTRVFYLHFRTNAGKSVSGGTMTEDKATATAPEGYQLGGFYGRASGELYLLGVVWSSILPVDEAPAAPVVSEDIQLSEVFGGPHGIAFSDIRNVKLSQTVSSLTLRTGARSHGISLGISAPVQATFQHGGTEGEEHTLVLAAGEYITSMEAHWGKKDGHTRIFHLNFGTSKGQTISGGDTTGDRKTITAPKGFQLSGFHGRSEGELDQLGVIWTRIGATDIPLFEGSSIRNWVGPTIGDPTDTACYRKSVGFGANSVCPVGYSNDDDDCLAQCPLSYPVRCFAECIPQNDDCASEIIWKVGSVVAVAFNVATLNVFGSILSAYKTAKWAITCAANVISVVRSLIFYLRYQQTAAPQGDVEQLLTVAYQADVVLIDLPVAICACLGMEIPKKAQYADIVVTIVEGIVKQAITNGDQILSTGANALNFLADSKALNTSDTTVSDLQDLIDKNSSCGWELKRLTDRVVYAVNDVRNATPNAATNDIRVTVYQSPVVMNDIPTVTNNCMRELLASKSVTAAYQTRDMLRKTFGVIVDQLIEKATTDLGASVAEDEYLREVSNMGLVVLSTIDPTGIAYVASQFVQPICGPTAYLGAIDDGTLQDALGLETMDEAFEGSYGWWTKRGDGVVHFIFESTDTLDVTVVIHTGGDDFAEVDVAAGATVAWDSTIAELQDKNLYLDRWRAGILGLPGSGGGSLLMWVPRSSEVISPCTSELIA